MILLQDLLWRHVFRQKTEIKRGIQANSRKIVKHLMSKITKFSYISVANHSQLYCLEGLSNFAHQFPTITRLGTNKVKITKMDSL